MNKDDDRIDLSCLDPMQDEQELDRLTAVITARILAERRRKDSLWNHLGRRVGWAALAASFVTATIVLLAWLSPEPNWSVETGEPEYQLLSWSVGEHDPTTSEILAVLGDVP